MIRFLFVGFLMFVFCLASYGQTLSPCGTVSQRSEWLANFQKDGIDVSQRPVDFRIQVNAHLVGPDAGSGFDYGLMLNSLAALERDFDSTGIGFVVNLPIDTVQDSRYYNHDDVLEGADMMFANNKADALNIYFVKDPAGNCGYNLPYAGIAIAEQCAGLNDKTIAHEVGHALALPHPFLGWEGGQTADGSLPPNFTSPAPRTVTYDYTYFQDTLIRDTTIIDTTQVELVARTNCYEAADGFCDTPADYIAGRWTCNGDGLSPGEQLDPDGVPFQSDGTLIMGYADDDCQARFSDEQKAAMQAFAMEERSNWVRTTFDTNLVRGFATLALDTDGFISNPPALTFSSVPNATHYFVQVSARRSFSSLLVDTVVTSPSVFLSDSRFESSETYRARIYAFNDHSFLAGMSPQMEFSIPENVSSTASVAAQITVSPNPVRAGSLLDVPLKKEITNVQWYDARGALIAQRTPASRSQLEVPTQLVSGVYTLLLIGQDGNRSIARIQVIR